MGKQSRLPKEIFEHNSRISHGTMDDDVSSDSGMDGSFSGKKMRTSCSSTTTLDTDTDITNSSASQSSAGDEEDIEINDDHRHRALIQSSPQTTKKAKSYTASIRALPPSSLVVETSMPQPSPLGLRHRDHHIDLEENAPSPGRLTSRKPSKPYISNWDDNSSNTDGADRNEALDRWNEELPFSRGSAHEKPHQCLTDYRENIVHAPGKYVEQRKKTQNLLRKGLAHFIILSKGNLFRCFLLLTSCILLGSLVPFHDNNSRSRHVLDMGTRKKLSEERRDLLSKIRHDHVPWSGEEAYNVRLTATSGRTDLVQNSLDAHTACPSIRSIQVHWDENAMGTAFVPNGIKNHASGKVEVVLRTGTTTEGGEALGDSLLESEKRTGGDPNAVLLLSDDLVFTCGELDRAFKVWTHNPDRMVGFFPFQHTKTEADAFAPSSSSNASWGLKEVQRGRGKYTVLSDRAAFVHKEYMTSNLSAVRTGFGPCDSFGLSLGITSFSSKPPIAVLADPLELRSSRYSRKGRDWEIHGSERCLPDLMESLDLSDLPPQKITYIGG